MGFGGFSWKRAVGLTKTKTKISKSIGVPFTKSGRQRKLGAALGGAFLGAFVGSSSKSKTNNFSTVIVNNSTSYFEIVKFLILGVFFLSIFLLIFTSVKFNNLLIAYGVVGVITLLIFLSKIKTCLNCEKAKTLRKDKVCINCLKKIYDEANPMLEEYKNFINKSSATNRLSSLVSDYDSLLEKLDNLLKYENKNIQIFNYSLNDLIEKVKTKQNEILNNYFETLFSKTENNSFSAVTIKGQISHYTKFMNKLDEYKKYLDINFYDNYFNKSKNKITNLKMQIK